MVGKYFGKQLRNFENYHYFVLKLTGNLKMPCNQQLHSCNGYFKW